MMAEMSQNVWYYITAITAYTMTIHSVRKTWNRWYFKRRPNSDKIQQIFVISGIIHFDI